MDYFLIDDLFFAVNSTNKIQLQSYIIKYVFIKNM